MNFSRMNLAASLAISALFSVAPGFAANIRSWVSNNGSDANSCTVSAPCLSFQHAHDQTVSGGEVNVLTPGDYGILKIDRAITIDGGNMAYITVHGLQKGIDVEPAATGATVVIRNLSINSYAVASVTTTGGANTTNVGIYWGNGQILHIEAVAVNGTTQGIQAQLASTVTGPRLFLNAVTVRNCALHGVNIFSSLVEGGMVWMSVERALLENNYNGLYLINVRASISRSNINGNLYAAILADHNSSVNVEDTNIVFSNIGIYASGNTTVRMAANNIHDNQNALLSSGSSILSFGNNRLMGNLAAEVPSATVVLK